MTITGTIERRFERLIRGPRGAIGFERLRHQFRQGRISNAAVHSRQPATVSLFKESGAPKEMVFIPAGAMDD